MALTIKWDMQGFRDLRTSDGVMERLDHEAERIAAAAGDGFEAKPPEVTGGRVRGRAAVVTATPQARVAEATNHNLLRALGGSGA